MNNNQQIIKTDTNYIEKKNLLLPLTPEDAKLTMEMYQKYVEALIDENDVQMIGNKKFKKKSAWRKLAMGCNLSVRVVGERREELPHDDFAYHFTCEATHPNGRVTSGTGSCTAYEKYTLDDSKWINYKGFLAQPNSLHNVRSTAETRAWNRAVSNMIAAGEVSAEEVLQGEDMPINGLKKADPRNQPITPAHPEAPHCPKCNGEMEERARKSDGNKFWGCMKYPFCKGVLSMKITKPDTEDGIEFTNIPF